MRILYALWGCLLFSAVLAAQPPCKVPENPLGKKPRVEIRKTAEKAVIQINDFPAVEYYFAPEEKEDFPSSAYDAIFSDIRLVRVGDPCSFMIVGMTIRNVKKVNRIFHYKIEPPVSATVEQVAAQVEKRIEREIAVSGAMEVASRELKVSVWDNQNVDGDSISIFFNDNLVLERFALSKTPGIIEITLREGANILTLFAHNLGTAPPNTAAITVDDGKTHQTRILSSNLHTCGAIEVLLSKQ